MPKGAAHTQKRLRTHDDTPAPVPRASGRTIFWGTGLQSRPVGTRGPQQAISLDAVSPGGICALHDIVQELEEQLTPSGIAAT